MNMTSTAGPVIVFGGANIDVKARIEGHAVEGTSNYGAITRSPGGVGRNIAENLARLGVPVGGREVCAQWKINQPPSLVEQKANPD